MFAIFLNNVFVDFWGNQIGDKFFDLTCKSMKWNKENVSMVYFDGIELSELKHAEASLEKCDIFTKEMQQTGQETVDVLDENGIKTGEQLQPIFSEVKTLIRSIDAVPFVINGVMVKPC